MASTERLQDVIAEMREWAHGEGCFNDDPEGEPLLCVYYSQQAFLSLCDRIEAASALSVRGWQPIETAPRDGTHILLCSNGGAAWMGFWRLGDRRPYGCAGWTRFNCDDVDWMPENWMPLPDPPSGT